MIEPGTPGAGVYDLTLPDYLLLNNECGQLSLYPYASEDDQPRYGIGLYEWAVAQGYRWTGERCAVDASGEPIESHHFLPRRLMGEYLQWFYRTLVAEAPSTVRITHHPTSATDVVEVSDGSEQVRLADGQTVTVDHVIVTSGHTPNAVAGEDGSRPRWLSPYPVSGYAEVPAETTVAVAGLGLVAIDVVITLTVGRGGRFVENGNGLHYQPSGREPAIQLFSRSGLPFTAKSVTGPDRTNVYKPLICTPQALDSLSGRNNGHRRLVDARTELLPLLFAEMYARYYAQVAFQAGSIADAAAVRERLQAAWVAGRFDYELGHLAARYGSFDAEELFFGPKAECQCSDDYERQVYAALADDLREAEVPDGASPIKSASQVFRIFRDPMRSVVEQGGLSLDSYLDFNADLRSRIHRLVAGPPAIRSRQLLALIDADVLRVPYGPAPTIACDLRGGSPRRARTRITATAFERPHAADVDLVIRGHLDNPRLDRSASQLLTGLYNRGRISQFRYGAVTVGSVDLTVDSHPIDIDGRVQPRISIFGVLTEGVRHFTHYLPSPKSRIRAFEEIGACVNEILA